MKRRSGMVVAQVVMAVGGMGVAGWSIWWGMSSANRPVLSFPTSQPAPNRIAPMRNSDVAAMMMRCGLAPEHLNAAGVSAEGITAVFTAMKSHLSERFVAVRQNEIDYAAKNRVASSLDSKVRSGLATAEDRQTAATRRSEAAALKSAYSAYTSAALAAATESLTENQRALIATLHHNASQGVPLQYRGVNRTAEQWIALRDALTHRRQRQAENLPVAEGSTTYLDAAELEPSYTAITARSLATIDAQQAFKQLARAAE